MENHIDGEVPPAVSAASGCKPPPASWRAIQNLSFVRVTSDDLLEEMSKECLICLEKQIIGALACKLACGHMYHHECIVKWLQMNCTCPVCRYELQTDNVEYESNRRRRMCKRSVRFRMDELRAKKVSQLREVASSLLVNLTGCIEKSEVIERLLTSGRIQIIEGAPAIVKSRAEFEALSVAELKIMLLSFGLSRNGALEKSELQSRLLTSGKVEIEGCDESCNGSTDLKDKNSHYSLEARNDDSKILYSQTISNKYFNDNDYPTLDSSATPKTTLPIDDVEDNLAQKVEQGSDALDHRVRVDAVTDTSYSYSTSLTSTVRTDISRFITNRSSEHIKGGCHINGDSDPAGSCRRNPYASYVSVGKEKDIRSMSIAQLQQLSADLSVSTTNCLYKSDVIDRLLASGRISLSGASREEQVL